MGIVVVRRNSFLTFRDRIHQDLLSVAARRLE
jgi:hypothetical protein